MEQSGLLSVLAQRDEGRAGQKPLAAKSTEQPTRVEKLTPLLLIGSCCSGT